MNSFDPSDPPAEQNFHIHPITQVHAAVSVCVRLKNCLSRCLVHATTHRSNTSGENEMGGQLVRKKLPRKSNAAPFKLLVLFQALSIGLALSFATAARATLISSFSFNGLPSSGDAGSQVDADSSAGAGKDDNNNVVPGTISSFSVGPGTTENKDSGNGFTATAGRSLAIDTQGTGNNGQYILFKFSVSGYTTLTNVPLSFAAKQSASAAFTANNIKVANSPFAKFASISGTYTPNADGFTTAVFNLSNLSAYSSTGTLYVQLYFSGATGSGFEYIDNVNLGSSPATPEVNSTLLFATGSTCLLLLRRRHVRQPTLA